MKSATSSPPVPTLRERVDRELDAARAELPKASEACRAAGDSCEALLRARAALTLRFAPIVAHVASTGGVISPLLAAERQAIEAQFEAARKEWGLAEGRELAAKRRLAAAELADWQLKLIGE